MGSSQVALIDFIKLDKTLIDELNNERIDYILTEAFVNISHQLSAKVIAEGVETERQIIRLNMMACDYIQGYYYLKPLKMKDALAYLKWV